MAKNKKASKGATAVPAPKSHGSKPLDTVKAGRVTKPAAAPKSVAQQTAKKTAKAIEKESSKKTKAPVPEPEDEDDDDEDEGEDETSESSESSDDEDDEETTTTVVPKANGTATAPTAAAAAITKDDDDDDDDEEDDEEEGDDDDGDDDDDDDDDDSSEASDSDVEVATTNNAAGPKANGVNKPSANAQDKEEDDDDDDEEDEEDEDDEDDEDKEEPENQKEADAKAGAHKLVAKTKAVEDDTGDDDDDEDDDDDDDDDEEDADDDEEDDDEAEEDEQEAALQIKATEMPTNKRKAEKTTESTPKRAKIMVDGKTKEPTTNLWCGSISWNVDEEWLTREFEEFGELAGVRIITDRESGRSKGYGYIEFKTVDSAVQAFEAKNGTEIDGRNIRLDFSEPRKNQGNGPTPQQRSSDRAQRFGDVKSPPSSTIFCGNISFNCDEDTLTEVFSEYGTVKGARLPTDPEKGTLKGFGYVTMGSVEEATAALEALQGVDVAGRSLRLDYAAERASNPNQSPRGGRGGFGGRGGRGGFQDRGGRGGGRGGFGNRGGRGGKPNTTNRGGFGDFSGKKTTF